MASRDKSEVGLDVKKPGESDGSAKTDKAEPPLEQEQANEKLPIGASESKSGFGVFKTIFENISVEPFIFLYCMGFGITMIVTPILYINKICRVCLCAENQVKNGNYISF